MRKPSPQLLDLLADCAPALVHIALALRKVILAEAPDAEEVLYSVYAQVIVYRYPERKRGAFCYIAVYRNHVNLGFYFGASLPDPHRLLRGTGKQMRHIQVDSPESIDAGYLRPYIRSAMDLIGEPAIASKKKLPRPRAARPR